MRTAIKRALLLSIGLAIGLVAAEACLRVLGASYPLPYAADPICGTRLQPGFRGWWRKEGNAFIEINRHGFRHGERGPHKPAGALRVAVLGDSFIEAFHVPLDQTFCAVLERELAACDAIEPQSVEVLNFGVSGYGTAQERLMLQHYVWQYEPDVVVLAFFAGNDLRNNSADLEPYRVRPFYRLQNGNLTLDNSFRQHPDFLRSQSASVRIKVALINRLRILQFINHLRTVWRQTDTLATDSRPWRLGIDLEALAEPRDENWSEAWEVTERLIAATAQEAKRHDASFWLVSVPGDVQVHPDAKVGAECQRELGVDDLLYAERRLEDLAVRHDLSIVTLAEPMQRWAREQELALHGFDNTEMGFGHWNAAGHRLAGEIVAAAICAAEEK